MTRCWMIPDWVDQSDRIDLRNITLWSCVWTPDPILIERTIRVMKHCTRLADFGEVVFFCCAHWSVSPEWRLVRIPQLTIEKWNAFVNREVPKHIGRDFAMSVHEDGFIINSSMWVPVFLHYDYIGAPWLDGVVGNQGFSIESRRLLNHKLRLPANNGSIPSDNYLCRVHRKALERRGIRFAHTGIAEMFSTEMYGDDRPSFGFHGRGHSHRKYALGWEQIEEMEKAA